MIEVIYEVKNILAVNKPSGVVVFHENSSQEESLSSLLAKDFPEILGVGGARNGAVHRLDKETSGIILFAKKESSLSFLQSQLLEKKAKKRYISLVFRKIRDDKGEIRTFIDRSPKDRRKQKAFYSPPGKREAVTFFSVMKRFESYSLLEVFPKTGRKHQLRCHLSFIGHPIAGDKLYRFKDQLDPPGLKRHFLHASEIEIETPSGTKNFKAPLPEYLEKILNQLS